MASFFSKKRNVVFTAIFYTFLWGCAFPLVKICMDSFGIIDGDNFSKCLIAGIRFTLSGIIALSWCAFKDEERLSIKPKAIKTLLLYGILSTSLQYAFTYVALSRMDSSKGAVFDQLCVFVIVLCGGLIFREDRLTVKKTVGCIIGFVGVLIINTDGISLSFDIMGEGVMLLAVLAQTLAYFVAKGTASDISAPKLVGYGQTVGGVILCGFSLIMGGRIHTVNAPAILSLVALILISSLAYMLSLAPLKYFPASEISSFNLLITVFGVIMSAIVLGEDVLRWNYFLSLSLLSAGIVMINLRKKESKR